MELSRKTWTSIFIAAIMILSVMGFALTFGEPGAQPMEYGGYKFTRTQNGWQTKINDNKVEFFTFPGELEDIQFDPGAGVALDGSRVLWFSYNPKDLYAQEIADTLYYMEDLLGKEDIYVQRGLVNNTDFQLPEITCANATVKVPVLILQSGNETSIKHSNGCIVAAAGSGRDIYRVADRVLYQAFKVIK